MELRGINAIFINQYIEFKRNLGYAFKATYNLGVFDRFTVANGVNVVGLTRELAEKWAEKRPNESEVTRYKRVGDVINFSKYLNHLGYNSFIPNQTKRYRSTFTPYIFSHDNLQAFFAACDSYEVHGTSTMKYVIPVVFRVIYGCGLRANEALSLKCGDVHLDEKYIVIREAKNGCDRMLPISGSLAAVCNLYQQRYLRGFSSGNYFFPQRNKSRYAADTLYRWFRKIICKAGISHGGKGLGPRVHDLRHSFSVHSLEAMSRSGLDLYYSLPILSKYLGHRSLEATDAYVRLTFEMYPELVRQVDNLCSYVFPEVELS
jgi:integrase